MQASKAKWIISESGAIDVSSKHKEQAWNMGELNGRSWIAWEIGPESWINI